MIGVRLPDGRTVNVNTTDPQAAAKAARLMLAREAITKSGMGGGRQETAGGAATSGLASGATFGLSDVADGLINAGITGVKNLALKAQGQTPTYGMADAYAADRQLLKEKAAAHPVASTIGNLVGSLGSPVNTAVGQFVAKGAPAVAAKAPALAKGLLAGEGLAPQVARGGATGGLLGGLSGAATADPGQELQGAKRGAIVGGAMGSAAPVAAQAVGYGAGRAADAGKVIARAANKVSGGKLLDAPTTAAQRLTEALKADGATPDQMRSAMNDWLKNGATSPTLMDLASTLPNGGAKTLGMIRGAALGAGPARGAAATYAERTETALPARGIALAKTLTSNQQPANAVEKTFKAARGEMAATQYPEAYSQTVDTTPVMDAVAGNTGRKAISQAAGIADAGRFEPELQELTAIKAAANPPPAPPLPPGTENLGPAAQAQARAQLGLTGDAPLPPMARVGTLDHVKQAFHSMADAEEANNPRLAMYLRQRAGEIDQHLGDVSQPYAIARDNFAAGSRRLDGLDLGRQGMTMPMDEYGSALDDLIGQVKGAGPSVAPLDAGVGYRQSIVDSLAHQPAGATGTLKRLGTAPDQTANLAKTYGEDAGGQFQTGVNQLRKQLANARFIDATQGSKTASAALDADLSDVAPPSLPKGPVQALYSIVNKVRQGATLTDPEREAIVQMGIAKPEDFIPQWHVDPRTIVNGIKSSGAYLAAPLAEQSGRQ